MRAGGPPDSSRLALLSHDWIDNLGRRSPERLTPGLEWLEVGQEIMTIFRLDSFEQDRHLTLSIKSPRSRRLFGELAVSYVIQPAEDSETRCRLLAKLVFRYRENLWGVILRHCLPLGDLIMMRRQLLNLKRLSEADAQGDE
jgi:hypothetical protein